MASRTLSPTPSLITPASERVAAGREPRVHSPWRRSACDRYRGQKLRCTRKVEDIMSPCVRCAHLGSVCFTGSAKSPSRRTRRRSISAASSSETELHRPSNNTSAFRSASAAGGGTRKRAIESQNPTLPPLYLAWPFLSDDGHPEAFDNKDHGDRRDHDDHEAPTLSMLNEGDSANIFDFCIDNNDFSPGTAYHLDLHSESQPQPQSQSCTPPPFASSLPSLELPPVASGELWPVSERDLSSQLPTPHSVNKDTPDPIQSGDSDPIVLLAGLQQSLSRQLVLLKSIPWDLSVLSIAPSIGDSHESSQGSTKNEPFNPLALILGSTSEFLAISRLLKMPIHDGPVALRADSIAIGEHSVQIPYSNRSSSKPGNQFYPSRTSEPHSRLSRASCQSSVVASSPREALGHTAPPAHTTWPPQVLGSVHLLTTICCYSLVISLFDAIFSQIMAKLNDSRTEESSLPTPCSLPSSSSSSYQLPQLVPELVFAGHSVPMDTRLRTRLLIQVVEHQLELLERSLGLPSIYRVSTAWREDHGSNDRENGILDRREARALLRAIIGDPAEDDDFGNSNHRANGISRALSSLKSNLRKL